MISKGVADETLFRIERYDQTGSLEVLLARARANDCKALLEMASEGKIDSVVTHFSIHSIEAIMRKLGNELTSFLRVLVQTRGC